MKRDEPFDPTTRSTNPPENLKFRLAVISDRETISKLMAERNPDRAISEVLKTTDRELQIVATDEKYRLYVADLDGVVLGFCRFYHSSGLPQSKKTYPAPEGWYGMGILVDSHMRRRGIAKFLSLNRLKILKEIGVKEIYSVVDAQNLTSIRMHLKFGFEQIATAPGFLHIGFEGSSGILFRMATSFPWSDSAFTAREPLT